MRSNGRFARIAFAAALITIFFSIESLAAYVALILIASMLGGVAIGRRSAVYLALGTLGVLALLDAWEVAYVFRVSPHTHLHPVRVGVILLAIALAGGGTAAVGVRLRPAQAN